MASKESDMSEPELVCPDCNQPIAPKLVCCDCNQPYDIEEFFGLVPCVDPTDYLAFEKWCLPCFLINFGVNDVMRWVEGDGPQD